MLSHLRFHRRGASNPASPTTDQPRSSLPLESPTEPLSLSDLVPPSSSSSALPPTLPPIARVTESSDDSLDDHVARRNDIDGGFIGGVALLASRHRPSSSGNTEDATSRQRSQAGGGPSKPRAVFSLGPSSDATPSPPGAKPVDSPQAFSSPPSAESQRARKSLPFLKNPMSTLLMRRKHGQNAPHLPPLPLAAQAQETVYDPRIRGTRVHDFSAPRRKQTCHSRLPTDVAGPERVGETADQTQSEHSAQMQNAAPITAAPIPEPSQPLGDLVPSASDAVISGNGDTVDAPPVPPKDISPASSQVPASSAVPSDNPQIDPRPSSRTVHSQDMPLSDMSALPKHMKSTSSRFSFDMIGAAKQEKLLEERHRQRELEKQTAPQPSRDSRFDDFDEDGFDYDAMMDDGGLEEQIPGVNVDLEQLDDDDDLDEDPDNDQENFAGFVFQRSQPASSIASPRSTGVVATPRDVQGNVIGFALTQDGPIPATPDRRPGAQQATDEKMTINDEWYFNASNEFAEELGAEPELGSTPFDESIFDINDTDEHGRPVPGAFAHAQSLRRTTNGGSTKRQSDLTSRLSALSCFSPSTADTSPGEENRAGKSHETLMMDETDPAELTAPVDMTAESSGHFIDASRDSGASYQAALVAAAHQAVASGKFERVSWASEETGDSHHVVQTPDMSDDVYAYSNDEYSTCLSPEEADLNEDAIIAEANASALANDCDGWYGQEFGFYSAPLPQHHGAHGGNQPAYEYVHGGYFGPKGMDTLDRSASGRMVSREPNLTPITERSEYSNRNSFMSLGLPSLSSPAPMMHSPGLAQLAMMPDRGDDEMTLSALLRLRSRAWGGSQASQPSSRDGSPRSDRGETTGNSAWTTASGRKPSTVSSTPPSTAPNKRRDSEATSMSESPTFTCSAPILPAPPPIPTGEAGGRSPSSPEVQASQPWPLADSEVPRMEPLRRDHQRHKSSSDSVSYLRQGQEDGETRWIVERRRTAESGQIEILGREVVEGGRI